MEGKAAFDFEKIINDRSVDRRPEDVGLENGPLLADDDLYAALGKGFDDVLAAAGRGEGAQARRLFASRARKLLLAQRERFLTIPYEMPENIYKLPGEEDGEACRRLGEHKVVSVGVLGDFSERGRIDWMANPTSNGYREWTWQLSRHNEIKMMAHEYLRTGDGKIASDALSIMRSWLDDAIAPPVGTSGYATKCWRTIECGIRMGANWPYILFAMLPDPAFDDDLLIDWLKSVLEHARRLSHDRTRANWLIMEMNGLAHIGILFPFFKDASRWLDDAVSTLDAELGRQFYPDGFQYELTTNYHDVVVNNYQRLFETAQAFNVPLPEDMRRKLVKATRLYVELMMCDGTTPDVNDGRRASAKEFLQPKARFFNDETIDFVLNGGKEPDFTSLTLPWSGFAVFRSGWKEDDVWALLDCAPFGRAHQHEDKLSLMVYGKGRLLVTEGGNYAYDDSPMRRYILSSASHNTVLVDGHGQDRRSTYEWHDEDIGRRAEMESCIPDDETEWAEACYEGPYEGIADRPCHRRRVIFLRKEHCFVVVDSLKGSEEHEYEALFHIDDTRVCDLSWQCLNVLVPDKGVESHVVRGQMEPYVQGYVATGQAQGQYKEVDCLTLAKRGKEVRLVTVLDILDTTSPAVESASLEGGRLTLHYDGHDRTVEIG